MANLVAYGAYIPHHRLRRATIASALETGGGRGTRSVAGFDEDTTTMGVEAARRTLRRTALAPQATYFATTEPAYLDKTNACTLHAALGLSRSAFAADMTGAVRSGMAALLAAHDARRPTLAVLADIRGGRPGGADERDGGDAAAAFLFAEAQDCEGIAEVLAVASATEEFLDRWRLPGATASRGWEERFGESVYVPLAHAALTDALKAAGVAQDEIAHLIATGPHRRAVARFARETGAAAGDLLDEIGYSGAAHVGLLLADVLDRAEPGELIAVTLLADGATTVILRVLPGIVGGRAGATVREQVDAGDDRLGYATFLTWRGLLDREPPRRPDPEAPAAPPAQRNEQWKFRLVASACTACGNRALPPARVCVACGASDQVVGVPMADTLASVTTYTIDRLAYTPSPPLVAAVLDFDGGGRLRCQLTEVDAQSVSVGDRVEMTFRRMSTARGIHNYFWKARPVRPTAEGR